MFIPIFEAIDVIETLVLQTKTVYRFYPSLGYVEIRNGYVQQQSPNEWIIQCTNGVVWDIQSGDHIWVDVLDLMG